MNNGRITNINENKPVQSIPLFQENKQNTNSDYHETAVSNIQQKTVLSNIFFSQQNIDNLQNIIRYRIYNMTDKKHIISKQSDTDLKIVMRSYYLQFSKHCKDDIKGQVQELNDMVLVYCIPQIYNELMQYFCYVNDIQKLPEPIPRALNLSSKGTKTLKSIIF